MNRYLKQYFFYPDIMAGFALLAFCLWLGVSVLSSWHGWVSVIAGMLVYASSEYTFHRFLFHMKPPKNQTLLKLLRRLHYDHHVEPDELHLLFLPIWYSFPLIVGTGLIAYAILGSWALTGAFVAGITIFLLYYEWVHYIAHRPIKPLTRWGKYMKRLHILHHYKNENYWYGVTTPTFDAMLGTYRSGADVPKSDTAKRLEGRQHSL